MSKPTITTSRGVDYYHTLADATAKAQEIGGRVVSYLLGYAVQFHKSGPYYGPLEREHHGCRFCQDRQDK